MPIQGLSISNFWWCLFYSVFQINVDKQTTKIPFWSFKEKYDYHTMPLEGNSWVLTIDLKPKKHAAKEMLIRITD